MPKTIVKSTEQDKLEMQGIILDVISDRSMTTKQLRKQEELQPWDHKWDEVKLILYALCNIGVLRNVSVYAQTSGTAYGITELGEQYYELIKEG